VPATLDWDLWLGAGGAREPDDPAHRAVEVARPGWDFGTGALGDMGCHIIDPAFWALDLGAPSMASRRPPRIGSPRWSAETFPRASIVRFKFPARGNRPPVALTWYDGRLMPPMPEALEPGRKSPGSGALIIGDKGALLHGFHGAAADVGLSRRRA
jgi:hypothetical protein